MEQETQPGDDQEETKNDSEAMGGQDQGEMGAGDIDEPLQSKRQRLEAENEKIVEQINQLQEKLENNNQEIERIEEAMDQKF